MLLLREHYAYRLASNMRNKDLAGKGCIFLGMIQAGGFRRARIRLMNADGGTENQPDWYVTPSLLLATGKYLTSR